MLTPKTLSLALSLTLSLGVVTLASPSAARAAGERDQVKGKAAAEAKRFLDSALKAKGSVILGAVREQNSKIPASIQRTDKTPPKDLGERDTQWIAWARDLKRFQMKLGAEPKQPDFIKAVMENPCSKALRELKAANPTISELFVMDRIGANVCAAEPTSDYDQGDEAKWIEPFTRGVNPHLGNPERDASSGIDQVQVSYLLEDGSGKIGVITIGVKVSK